MARTDLLALTADDLVSLSNRGLVKRARQEMDAGQITVEMTEDSAGDVRARWSDDVECILPAGVPVARWRCACPSTTICRHLIRSVLAYQRQQALSEPSSEGSTAPWDPGALTDEDLARHLPKPTLARSRRLYEEGHLVELTRGRKPGAIIHTLSCAVRFLVPGDVSYTHCDCSESAPCSHVAIAVWAFRRLAPGAEGGLVSTHEHPMPVPTALLDAIEQTLAELTAHGISNAARALIDRFRRLEVRARGEGLAWPAEVLVELAQQIEGYQSHDARFSPVRSAELVGELCVRMDAIRSDTGAVPSLFVRGAASDRITEIGSARLVGLGCGAHIRRGTVEIAAYLQDIDSGTVVSISRDFADPDPGASAAPRSFAALAQTPVVKGVVLAGLGSGQALVKGGKRTPACRFLPGRSPVSLQPQAFAWEALRAPVLVEDFTELRARLSSLPPPSLRPRRVANNLFVCPVAGAADCLFNPREQVVTAALLDQAGERAMLLHPYLTRGAAGTDRLLSALQTEPDRLCFVAGHARMEVSGPVFMPTALVFDHEGTRTMIQPWVEYARGANPEGNAGKQAAAPAEGRDDPEASGPWKAFLIAIQEALGELLLLGLERADDRTARAWGSIRDQAGRLGFARIAALVGALADHLEHRQHVVRWETKAASDTLLQLLVLTDMARHLPSI